MKNNLVIGFISLLILSGLLLIGLSIDKLFDKDKIFLWISIGIGLIIIARYLEIIRKDD